MIRDEAVLLIIAVMIAASGGGMFLFMLFVLGVR